MTRLLLLLLLTLFAACKDGGSEPDAALEDGPPGEPPPGSGAVIINELMADPGVAYDSDGEWLELHNPGTAEVDLEGWTLRDDRSDRHLVKDLRIAPGKLVVLGRSKDKSRNGGVPVDYAYDGVNLNNGPDELVLVDAAGNEVDRVVYTGSWGIYSGVSLGVRAANLDNALAASWCPAESAWAGSAGDKGSPGAANTCGSPPPPKDGGGGDGLPYLQHSISFNESLCAGIESGAKRTTLRNGWATYVVAGEWVKLVCSTSKKTFKAQLTMVRLTTWGGIQPDEYQADGFSSQASMMQIMQSYYPGITLEGKATVIQWDKALPYP